MMFDNLIGVYHKYLGLQFLSFSLCCLPSWYFQDINKRLRTFANIQPSGQIFYLFQKIIMSRLLALLRFLVSCQLSQVLLLDAYAFFPVILKCVYACTFDWHQSVPFSGHSKLMRHSMLQITGQNLLFPKDWLSLAVI